MKGLWFYGLAGVGKTTAAKYYCSTIRNGFVVDGDMVRSCISRDLGYAKSDRETQIGRILGFNRIVIENNYFPIATSVFMNLKIFERAKTFDIKVIEITRSFVALEKVRNFYKGEEDNVVGMSIKLPNLHTEKIENCGTDQFLKKIRFL